MEDGRPRPSRPVKYRVGADVSSAQAEHSSAASLRPLKRPSRLGKGSNAQGAIGKGTSFSRANQTL